MYDPEGNSPGGATARWSRSRRSGSAPTTAELKGLLEEHAERTGNTSAAAVLAGEESLPKFVKVFPSDFKAVLLAQAAAAAEKGEPALAASA